MNPVHTYDNYRKLLKDLVTGRKNTYGSTFTYARLAERMKIQRTYLSAVVNERAHVSSDQLFVAMQFLNLTDGERQFLELLHQWETSENRERRAHLLHRIESLRDERMKAKNYVRSKNIHKNRSDPHLKRAFLNVDAQLVHVFLTIEKYRRNPEQIRAALQITEEAFRHVLGILVDACLIEMGDAEIRVLSDNLHLSSESDILHIYKLLMRQKAMQRIQSDPLNVNFGFSAIFSTDGKTRMMIRQNFLDFIEACKVLTENNDGEEVLQMNFDLIRWN
jgi:plasmid maintenance system antidote protein VapI